jgi:hypothetical protein
MLDRSKGRGQMNCSPWSFRFGIGRGANNPTLKRLLLRNHGGDEDPTQDCSAMKEDRTIRMDVKEIG